MTRIEELHAIVRPWREVLRAAGSLTQQQHEDPYHAPYEEGDRILWLEMGETLPDQLMGEALALLALLGTLDPVRWEQEVRATWMEEEEEEDVLYHDLDVRIASIAPNAPLVGLIIEVDNVDELDDMGLRHLVSAMITVSARYKREFAALYEEVTSRGLTLGDLRAPVRIRCFAQSATEATALLRRINGLTNMERNLSVVVLGESSNSSSSKAREAARLRIHEVAVKSEVGLDGISALEQLVGKQIRVHELPRFDAKESRQVRRLALEIVRVLLPDRSGGVERVVITFDGWMNNGLALVTALRFSQSIRTTVVDLSGTHNAALRLQLYRWVAYALFCDGSKATTKKLVLHEKLTPEEVAAMREMIAATNPLAVLLRRGSADSQPIGQLHATRFYLDEVHLNDVWTSAEAVVADVAHRPGDNQDPWWQVLLPGYGFAWVHARDIQRFVAGADLAKAQAVEELEFQHHGLNPMYVTTLLESIGQSIRCLREIDLDHDISEQKPWWFEQAMASCPKLERLVLPDEHRPSQCIDSLIKCTDAGVFHLHDLQVYSMSEGEVSLLLNTLGTRTHPLTLALKTLRLGVRVGFRMDMHFVVPLLNMLDRNRTLEYVSVDIYSYLDDIPGMHEFMRESMAPYTHPRRQELIAPCDSKTQVAFLSVVKRAAPTAAVARLDDSLCRLVIEFAGRRVWRSVELVFTDMYDSVPRDWDDDDDRDEEDPWRRFRRQ